MSSEYVARWSRAQGKLVIVDEAGDVVESFPVSHDGDRPISQLLWDTRWCGYPGSEWDEEPPGHWEIAVFPESRPEGVDE